MTISKRKKVVKYRGSKTHGCGSMKKRRGAGNRGGRGNAGTGKRADVKKPSYWKDKRYYGAHGFHSVKRKDINSINVSVLEQKIERLDSKAVSKVGDKFIVDLNKLGYNKLLGKGNLKIKLDITVDYASKKAIELVENAGGKVTLLQSKE